VVNVVTTTSNDVAAMLGTDPRLDLVSFTGSTAVGRLLMRQGADTMKRMFHRSLYDQAVADITAAYQLVPVGDPVDPDTFVGPVISAAQKDRVLTAIERGAPGRRGHHRGWWPGAGPARAPGGRALRGAHGGGRHVQQRGDRAAGGVRPGTGAPAVRRRRRGCADRQRQESSVWRVR